MPKHRLTQVGTSQVLLNGIAVLFTATHVTDCDIKTTAGGCRENSVVWNPAPTLQLTTPVLGNLTPPGLFRHCM